MNGSSGIVCVAVAVGLVLLSNGTPALAGNSQSTARTSKPSPEEMAQDIAKYSRQALRQGRPQESPKEVRRDGLYLLLSFSLADNILKDYLREAKLLGAKVLLRGLVQESFKVTQERIKQVLFTGEHPDESRLVGIGIDPVLYRTVGAGEVPALVFVKDEKFMVASGASSIAQLLSLLAEEQARVKPWVEWFERRHRGFLQGGPTEEAPPALPTIERSVKVRADARGADIAERDMIDVMKERVANANWPDIQRRSGDALKRHFTKGPGLALPHVEEARVVFVDPTVEYPEDIKDPTTDTVLIKSGTKINPFDKVRWIRTLVFFDGSSPAQVDWVRQYLRAHDPKFVKLIISDGDVQKVMEPLHQRVYWANPLLVSRMGVGAVPSVVSQLGRHLRVEEVEVHE
ncbi:MAG: hypothetical protein H8K05_19155 [Nitrospira sp.]|nr:hypothetical protein [Nitrospira sp.]